MFATTRQWLLRLRPIARRAHLKLTFLSSLYLYHHFTRHSQMSAQEHPMEETPSNLSPMQLQHFLNEVIDHFKEHFLDDNQTLSKLIHEGNQDPGELEHFKKDDNSYHVTHPPICILYPTSTADVSEFLKICNKHTVQVVPFTKGTSLEGGVLPTSSQCAMINLSQMNRVLNFYERDFQITVEPALGWMELNSFLEEYGLFFPVDPGPGAGIGGMVNTSCSGTNAYRYGTMRDWVVNMEVVMANGDVIQTAQRAKKSSAGYNLTRYHLMIGSEGTLGIVTKITLKLTHLPKINSVVTLCYDDLEKLSESVHEFIRNDIQLGCIELMDKAMINILLSRHDSDHYRHLLIKDSNLLMLKLQGDLDQANKAINIIQQISTKLGGVNFYATTNRTEIDNVWNIRKRALWIAQQYAHQVKGKCNTLVYDQEGQIWTTDVCVPISQLSKNIAETQQALAANSIIGPIVGHVGDGNYHVLLVIDYENTLEWEKIKQINHQMVMRAIASEGTCTGEHGIGIGKREFLAIERGEQALELMKAIKKTFDPKGILNPGKVFKIV